MSRAHCKCFQCSILDYFYLAELWPIYLCSILDYFYLAELWPIYLYPRLFLSH